MSASHRGGVGEEADAGGVEGREAEAGEHGGGDGDGTAEASGPFNESPEGEGDEQGLEATVRGEVADGVLDDFEVAGFEGDAVEEDGGEDNPADGQEAEGGSVGDRAKDRRGGHAVGEEGDGDSGNEATQAGHPCRFAKDAEHQKQSDDG